MALVWCKRTMFKHKKYLYIFLCTLCGDSCNSWILDDSNPLSLCLWMTALSLAMWSEGCVVANGVGFWHSSRVSNSCPVTGLSRGTLLLELPLPVTSANGTCVPPHITNSGRLLWDRSLNFHVLPCSHALLSVGTCCYGFERWRTCRYIYLH